ncbi:MAG: hypothetical protein ABI624_18230 [Casimicrobiaceae bacterium]
MRPGDLVLADETGACFVPHYLIAKVRPMVEDMTMNKREVMREIDAGISIPRS